MDELIQLIPVIIFILIALAVSAVRRQNRQRSEPDEVLEDEDGVFLPPWGNLDPLEEEFQPAAACSRPKNRRPRREETPSHDEDSADESEIPPSEVDRAAGAQIPHVDTIACRAFPCRHRLCARA